VLCGPTGRTPCRGVPHTDRGPRWGSGGRVIKFSKNSKNSVIFDTSKKCCVHRVHARYRVLNAPRMFATHTYAPPYTPHRSRMTGGKGVKRKSGGHGDKERTAKRQRTGQETKQPKYKTYDKELLKDALHDLMTPTARLRSQSDNTWTKALATWLTKVHGKPKYSIIPLQTLKRHFIKEMVAETRDDEEVKRHATEAKQRHSDAHSLLSGLEKKQMYLWLDHMRTLMMPPTSLELRAQVPAERTFPLFPASTNPPGSTFVNADLQRTRGPWC
jgi:hypothetical protein